MKGRFFGKRLVALAMCFFMGLPMLPTGMSKTVLAADTIPYISESHWARDELVKMAELKILQGDPDGYMYPDRAVTRAEFIAMLNRAFNYTQFSSYQLPFEDMTGEEWYANNIRVAYSQGYFSGQSEDIAGAENPITREEAATLMCRNLKVEEQSLQIDSFSDGKNVSQWSRDAISAAVEKGYIYGYNDGTFRPRNYITRAEAATMLSNSLGTILATEGSYSYGTINGNVTISKSGIDLSDTVITGDLYITEGVGTGYVNLNNVTVMGEVIVCGGGEGNWGGNSVNFTDCTITKLTADGPETRPVAIFAKGRTSIELAEIKSDAYIENSSDTSTGFGNIDLCGPDDTSLNLAGTFDLVRITKPRNNLRLGRGRIKNLVVDEDATNSVVTLDRETSVDNVKLDSPSDIYGRGDIGNIVIASNGTSVEMLPDKIEIRPGYSATINGQQMSSLDGSESSDDPRILAGYPQIDEIQPTRAKMFFSTNKPGTIRWTITYVDIDDIDADDIMKPHLRNSIKRSGALTADESNKQLTLDLSGLETNVEYRLSAMLVDARGQQSPIKELEFRTSDSTKPSFVSGYPKAVPKTSTSIDIDVITAKDCTVFWAVFPQGTVAPTVYEMRNQDYDGDITHGRKNGCDKNIEYFLTADGLEERVTYDIYVMASDGENDSKIVKLTASTKDTTPPQFIRGTPLQDKITDTSVDVRVASNENATVYWVLMERNATFPAPVPPAVEPPDLNSDEAKQQVVNGNNVFKSGRGNAKENVDSTVKVNGLKAETAYDLYMLLMDAAGNMSEVKYITIKTRDVIPPSAHMEFVDDIEGKPQVENSLKVVFSEEVWSAITRKVLQSGDEGLSDNFKLYDRTNGKPNEIVPIDFTKVTVSQGDVGQTVVTFPPEAFNYGEGLNSGSKYQFELNNIVDTSNNAMKNETLLEEFETVPPLVHIERTTAPEELDITFTIEPQSNKTPDTILFDMIFESDTSISFMLYKKENGVFRDVNNIYDPAGDRLDYEPRISIDRGKTRGGITLHYIIDRMIEGESRYHFEKFNELEPGEYGIKITAIGSDRDRYGWNKTVNMEVKCVAGAKSVMDALAGSPIDNFNTAIKNGASQVNYPTKFEVSVSFTDTVVPSFVPPYPQLEPPTTGLPSEDSQIADTLIRPQIMANRKAVMYYLIVPADSLDIERGDDGNYTQAGLDALALPILDNALNPVGSVWGTYAIESGGAVYQPTMEGLQPEREYDVFFLLKGTPPEPSSVWYKRIKTTQIAPPVLSLTVPSKSENSARVRVEADKSARVDWIVLPSNTANNFLGADGKVRPDQVNNLTEIIRNGSEHQDLRPVAYGSGTADYNRNISEYEMYVDVNNLERNIYYRLFAVAKTMLSNGQTVGNDSIIAVSEEFTPADLTPPEIVNISTAIGASSGSDAAAGLPYGGDITIIFNEPLYYVESEGDEPRPIDEAAEFAEMMTGSIKFTVVSGGSSYQTIKNDDGTTTRALLSCTLHFSGATDNMTVFSSMYLCDSNGNVAGRFYMTFHDMETSEPGSRKKSYWSYEFI